MACVKPYRTAEANAKAWLRGKKVIDKYLNILNIAEFKKRNHDLTLFAKDKYSIEGKWFFEENNKAIPNTKLFRKVDRLNGVTAKDVYYQLHENSNSEVNKRLNRHVTRVLKKLGIKVVSIEAYKKSYADRIGEDVMPIAIADLTNKIIAVNEKRMDLTTLPEEAAHFIVEAMWDEPIMRTIRGVNEEGLPTNDYLRSSKYWSENYNFYIEKYQGDEVKVEKEIVGKILAERMVEQQKILSKESLPAPIRRLYELLDSLIKRFFRATNKDVKLQTLAEEVEAAAGTVARNFLIQELPISEVEGQIVTAETSFKKIELELQHIRNNLNIKRREVMAAKVGLLNRELKTEYRNLVKKHGQQSIDNLRERLEELSKSDTDASASELQEIARLLELETEVLKDKANRKKFLQLSEQLRELNKNIKDRNFDIGLSSFVLKENGMLDTIRQALEKYKGLTDIHDGEVAELTALVDAYQPHIDNIRTLFEHGEDLGTNTKLLKDINKAVQESDIKLGLLKRMLNELANKRYQAAAEAYNIRGANYSLDASDISDINAAQRWFGNLSNVNNPIAKRFMELIYSIKFNALEKTQAEAVEFHDKMKENLGSLSRMKEMMETEDGKPTGFFLSLFRMGGERGFLRAKEDAAIDIMNKTIAFARSKKLTIPTHPDSEVQADLLRSWISSSETFGTLETRDPVKRFYKSAWAEWYLRNTRKRPDADKVIARRKAQMNETQFSVWKENNIKEVDVVVGNKELKYTYFSGELAAPTGGETIQVNWKGSSKTIKTVDWTNPTYKEKIKDVKFKAALDGARTLMIDSKAKLGVLRTLEDTLRLPQISKNFLDAILGKQIFKNLGSLLGDKIFKREDDTIDADRTANGAIFRNPPVRFNTPLKNPETLSTDLMRTIISFREMTNSNIEKSKALPEFLDLLATSQQLKYKDNVISRASPQIFDFRGDTAAVKRNIDIRLQDFLNTHIYGQTAYDVSIGKLSFTKLSDSSSGYVQNLLLLGNLVSTITGFANATIQSFIEAIFGEFTNLSDYTKAKREYFANFFAIVQDYKSGLKTHKITIALQALALVDSIVDSFSNLDKSKAIRIAGGLPNYGFWRAMDHVSKTQGMIAVAMNIRLVDGEWMVGKRGSAKGPIKPPEGWKTAKSLWDSLSVENGKLIRDETVTDEVFQLWKKKSSVLAQRLDQKLDAIHQGTIKGSMMGGFISMFMSWLYQAVEQRFKVKQYDPELNNWEEGYYRSMGRFAMENWKNNLVPALAELTLGGRLNHLLTGKEGIMDYTQVEGRKRILADMITLTTLHMITAVLLTAAADDKEDDYVLSMLTYTAVRLVMERGAPLSANELINYASRPIQGLDQVDNIMHTLGIFGEMFRLLKGEDEDTIRSGIYKGYTKRQKKFVKSVPLIRGLYENLGAGYVNEFLYNQGIIENPTLTTGTAPKMKANYITNQVINPRPLLGPFQFPFLGSISSLVGAGIVENLSDIENENLGDLP